MAGLLCHMLELAPIVLPPRLVAWFHVVVALPHPDGPIDELPNDVGVPSVSMSLGDHAWPIASSASVPIVASECAHARW